MGDTFLTVGMKVGELLRFCHSRKGPPPPGRGRGEAGIQVS